MACKDCIHEKVCGYYAEFEDEADDCTHFKNKADVAELKNIKWRPYYYISKAEPPVGGKRQDGWSCSVCGKHSYSRKEICDGCNTVMWTVDVR